METATLLLRHSAEPLAVTDHDTAARTITVRLCRWNTARPVIDPDGSRYREQYTPGSVRLADDVHVVDDHGSRRLIGRADPSTLRDDGDGPVVDVIVGRSAAGNDVLANVEAGVIRSISMEVMPVTETVDGDLVTRSDVIVHGIAFAFRPMHDAPILAVRGDNTNGDPAMSDTATIRDTPPVPTDTPPVVNTVDVDTLNRAIDEVRREIGTTEHRDTGHPAARFRSLDDYTAAAWSDPALRPLLNRALADQITTNNPGVIPPAWLSTVFGIVDSGRPTVTAFGVKALPDSGMEVTWPYFDGDLATLVGEQATQKTAITSVRVDLLKGSVPLRTFAGGSDLSFQLIRRSSPAYRDAYMQIMFAAYAAVTGNAAADAALAAATAGPTYDGATDTDGRAFAAALFAASAQVAAATGSPATFALASTDVFGAAGGLLIPAPYGTSNQAGTATASSLVVNVSGLPVIHDPYLPALSLIVSNGQAGGWFEEGPMAIAATDVERLGENVAVWGMGNFGATIPGGIVKLAATIPAGTTTSSKSSK